MYICSIYIDVMNSSISMTKNIKLYGDLFGIISISDKDIIKSKIRKLLYTIFKL